MKLATWAFCLALLTLGAQAQNPPAPPTPSAPPPPPGMHAPHGMRDMHMPDMKAQVEKMRATLDEMKANLAKIKDPAVKQQAQLDADLWEAMVQHLEGMVKMMSQAPDMPMGDMHDSAGCCAGMHHGDSGMKQGETGCCHGARDGAGGCCSGAKDGAGKCQHTDTSAKVIVPAD